MRYIIRSRSSCHLLVIRTNAQSALTTAQAEVASDDVVVQYDALDPASDSDDPYSILEYAKDWLTILYYIPSHLHPRIMDTLKPFLEGLSFVFSTIVHLLDQHEMPSVAKIEATLRAATSSRDIHAHQQGTLETALFYLETGGRIEWALDYVLDGGHCSVSDGIFWETYGDLAQEGDKRECESGKHGNGEEKRTWGKARKELIGTRFESASQDFAWSGRDFESDVSEEDLGEGMLEQ